MIEDIVKELGYLALGTRLKRLGERLQTQATALIESAGVDVPASHFPILAALDRLGALSVGALSEAVGVSQPGITRMLEKLDAEDWVKSKPSAGDKRVRMIELTKPGRQLVTRSKRLIWPAIEAAVSDACAQAGQPLLEALAVLEDALAATPLELRAKRLKQPAHASS